MKYLCITAKSRFRRQWRRQHWRHCWRLSLYELACRRDRLTTFLFLVLWPGREKRRAHKHIQIHLQTHTHTRPCLMVSVESRNNHSISSLSPLSLHPSFSELFVPVRPQLLFNRYERKTKTWKKYLSSCQSGKGWRHRLTPSLVIFSIARKRLDFISLSSSFRIWTLVTNLLATDSSREHYGGGGGGPGQECGGASLNWWKYVCLNVGWILYGFWILFSATFDFLQSDVLRCGR